MTWKVPVLEFNSESWLCELETSVIRNYVSLKIDILISISLSQTVKFLANQGKYTIPVHLDVAI